jgi:Ca2+:H+ antiporter
MSQTKKRSKSAGLIDHLGGVNLLLVMVPLTFFLERSGAGDVALFVVSALSIVPLAKIMGEATEQLAEYLGPTKGGLLNASLGNLPELIISFFALKAGLIEMVKSSITGSIISNLLFGLGITFLAMIKGKLNRTISFDVDAARVHSGLLILAIFGLIIPAVFDFSTTSEREISLEIAVVLFVVYVLSIIATFIPDVPKVDSDDALEIVKLGKSHEAEGDRWSFNLALGILVIVTVLLAFMSEIMSGALEPVTKQLGLSVSFVGVFVLALLGNTAEMISAIRSARNGQVDLAMGMLLGASAQMALMVAPTLVFLGLFFGFPMNLLFSNYDLLALILTVMAITSYLSVGQIRARNGVIFLAIYGMLGVGFYNAPG